MAGLKVGLRWFVTAVVGLVIAGVLVVFNPLAPLFGNDDVEIQARRERSEISVTSLSATVEAEGNLVFIGQRDAATVGAGTLTSVASVGSEVTASMVLFEIDSEPTLALIGDVAAWRTMRLDDVGIDVEQLETNLVTLGYDPDGELNVDGTFTDYTAVVVERWQADLGVDLTGTVAFGTVVFVPDLARVTSVAGVVGQGIQTAPGASGAAVLTVSSTDRQLVFAVAAEDLDTIGLGTEVSARLPDRSTVTGTVTEFGPSGDGTWSATAVLSIGSDVVLPDGESVPVTVSWTELIADEAKTVRANALTRLDSGAYVLEVVNDDDSTTFVEVGIGATSGSTVEVLTDLSAGTTVIAP